MASHSQGQSLEEKKNLIKYYNKHTPHNKRLFIKKRFSCSLKTPLMDLLTPMFMDLLFFQEYNVVNITGQKVKCELCLQKQRESLLAKSEATQFLTKIYTSVKDYFTEEYKKTIHKAKYCCQICKATKNECNYCDDCYVETHSEESDQQLHINCSNSQILI